MAIEKGLGYKNLLEEKGEISFVPSGNSMWPTLKNRKQTVVVQKKVERLNVFDVALFEKDGVIVLHRVMEVTANGYVTCGDSQLKSETVLETDVIGVLKGFYKGKKFVPITDKKHIKKVQSWYKRKSFRKFRIKLFYLGLRIKTKLNKIFKKG